MTGEYKKVHKEGNLKTKKGENGQMNMICPAKCCHWRSMNGFLNGGAKFRCWKFNINLASIKLPTGYAPRKNIRCIKESSVF